MKKFSTFIIAVALIFGMAQCKKQETPATPDADLQWVHISLKVDGDRHIVYPTTGAVVYTEGDKIYVSNGNLYRGVLTYSNGTFTGNLFFTEQQPMATNDNLHFYFLGGSTFVEPTPLQTTSFTVNISDQSSTLPVLSYGTSKNLYTDGTATYSCLLLNQCALVEFTTNEIPVGTVVSIGGMKNKVTVDFGNNTLAPSDETGSIMLHAASTTSRWAILLPQTESVTTTATAEGYYESYNFTVPSVAINDYLTGNDGACFGLFTPLTMPLTLEVLDYGNIMVNISGTLSTGMYYSVNGGEKHLIYTTTTIEDLDFGDKVQFYGNGTSTQVYGGDTEVKLLGTAETMVYGNIMSLIDEDNYATCTTLPNREYVFYGLFEGNSNLIDASGLLLPATTLASDCYAYMFYECTRLTAAPALPAETLVNRCYRRMFYGCTSLSSITCLATSGINSSSSTSEWMFNAGIIVTWTKTFTAASTATWPTGDNGIPKKWTRVNVQ